jgi:hypothetical protein
MLVGGNGAARCPADWLIVRAVCGTVARQTLQYSIVCVSVRKAGLASPFSLGVV